MTEPDLTTDVSPLIISGEMKLPLPVLICLQCGATWHPRRETLPKVCPVCKRYSWNSPKK